MSELPAYPPDTLSHTGIEGRIGAMSRQPIRTPFGQYQITRGNIVLSEGGQERANAGYLAYTDERGPDLETRPIALVYNGGPLSPASLWNAMSITGPYYQPVSMMECGLEPSPMPFFNLYSPLLHCDTVHMDPPGTFRGIEDTAFFGTRHNYFFGAQRDIDAAVVGAKCYLNEFRGIHRPIIVLVSSSSALRGTGIALEFEKQGIPVSAIGYISGFYDYRMWDYDQTDDPLPFSTLLPGMALANQYHNPDAFPSENMLYEKVSSFATEVYEPATANGGNLSADETEQLAYYTGLSIETIRERRGRIDDSVFSKELLRRKNKVLSLVDPFLTFDASSQTETDHALDNWRRYYGPTLQYLDGMDAARNSVRPGPKHEPSLSIGRIAKSAPGQSSRIGHNVPAYSEWSFTGLWANRRVHEAMIALRALNPHIRMVAYHGKRDLISSPLRAAAFWRQISQESDTPLAFAHDRGSEPTPYNWSENSSPINILTYDAGHQIGNDVLAWMPFCTALGALARKVTQDRKKA